MPAETIAAQEPMATTPGRLLKCTRSRCPVCQAACPAEVWLLGASPAKVFLRRFCARHGEASVCIASDARFYWVARGRPENAEPLGESPSLKTAPFKKQACCAATGCASGTLGQNADGRGEGPFEKIGRAHV